MKNFIFALIYTVYNIEEKKKEKMKMMAAQEIE